MSKEQSVETTVLESTVELCNKVRQELVEKFEYCWFYVYSNGKSTAKLTVANAFGGKLEKSLADEVVKYGKGFHSALKLMR